MELWLKGTKKIRIPVLPDSYSVTSEQNDTTVDVYGLGEVLLKGKRKLQTISLSSFFPKQYDSSYCEFTSIKSPKTYVDEVEKLKRAGAVKLVITGTPINFSCMIESFTWGEDDGTGDISYTLSLTEYRGVAAAKSSVTNAGSGSSSASSGVETRTEQAAAATTYTVKKGDTLTAIARKLTGNADWKPIYEANKAVIGSNPNLIYPGQVLTIS